MRLFDVTRLIIAFSARLIPLRPTFTLSLTGLRLRTSLASSFQKTLNGSALEALRPRLTPGTIDWRMAASSCARLFIQRSGEFHI